MALAYLSWDRVLIEHRKKMVERRKILGRRRIIQDPLKHLCEDEFLRLYRINKTMFQNLVEELRPLLQKRRSFGLSPDLQVLTALRFYASGGDQESIGRLWGCTVSQRSVSRSIRSVTVAINTLLLRKYIKFPITNAEREHAKDNFLNAPEPFPGTIGAIDCTHIRILGPKDHEEAYVNGHHEGHSINVQAICNADLLILNINARWPGARHDAHIWANSPVRENMKREYENGDHKTWLLGDNGYPLEPWLMIPITNQQPQTPEYKYTRAHCSARNVIERCFGQLKTVFRCLSGKLMYSPQMAGQIVNACAVLHNLRILYKISCVSEVEGGSTEYMEEDFIDEVPAVQRACGRAVAERIRTRIIRNHFT